MHTARQRRIAEKLCDNYINMNNIKKKIERKKIQQTSNEKFDIKINIDWKNSKKLENRRKRYIKITDSVCVRERYWGGEKKSGKIACEREIRTEGNK